MTGYDGIVVNHAALNEVGEELRTAVRAIDRRMNQLESELAPLQGDWTGEAKLAYENSKKKWDLAIHEMQLLLNDTGTTVDESNVAFRQADLRGAASMNIGT